MRIFITGATGFIGKYVVELLSRQKHKLLLLTRNQERILKELKDASIIIGDLSNRESYEEKVRNFSPDAAIHLGWKGIPDYSMKTSLENFKNSLSLFEVLTAAGCKKIIAVGSCWEYGITKGKLSENVVPQSTNAFTSVKNALHFIGREMAKDVDGVFIWLRVFYVYGAGQREGAIIPYSTSQVTAGKPVTIKTPWTKNDFVYVEDVADAICSILPHCNTSACYNIGSGHATLVWKIVSEVHTCLGAAYASPKEISKSADYIDYCADISAIKKDAGWVPKTTLSEGIRKTIKNINIYKSE